ncbi:MAG TPA: COX15/CtaA family protein [Alphaproteobacteria bacterium]|nr:COX15/CtaA family protein [Alphaproteobacteria bacterium]
MSQLSLALAPVRSAANDRAVGRWLLLCCAMIFAMVVIGGITRLTLSGLSIVQWKPIMGVIPPLTHQDWQAQFDLYKHTPQYLIDNRGMSLADFKAIFWWEYVHRLWGRLIGLAFLGPFLYFLLRGRIERRLAPRLALLFVLGALQGALGWFMVESGLVDRPSVSQYRLAAHLAMALVIYGAMLWIALDLLVPEAAAAPASRRAFARARLLAGWVFFVMISGAFVAGLHAGLIYNTFPLMDGKLIPDGLFSQSPFIANFFADIMTVQFDHRILAMTTVLLVVLFWLSTRGLALPPRARLARNLLLLMVFVQFSLGVSTLLLVVPVPLAAAHQAGALTLFTLALWTAHELRARPG